MEPRIILTTKAFELTLTRLCFQLIENHNDFTNSALVALQPRGIYLGNRLKQQLRQILKKDILYGNLDVTFYRDDFRRRDEVLVPSATEMDFIIENKKVILVDDVLYTGRTIRAGMDALLDFGRPESVELLVFVDRRYSRHLPIQPNYVGKTVDSVASEKVKVCWKETDGSDEVHLFTPKIIKA